MEKQLETVFERDGLRATIEYAEQTLRIYRACARPQKDGKKHFAHVTPFRPHFVRAIIDLRKFLKDKSFYVNVCLQIGEGK